tara:strand:- start:24727 stop:25878 length:1152 start_codon:yes stop_codon:yes gene_type:complete
MRTIPLFFAILFLLWNCSVEKSTVYSNNYSYTFDTIVKKYNDNLTERYTGGIDLLFFDSTSYEAFNFCGDNTLKIINHLSDSITQLSLINPSCNKIYTSIKKEGVYLVTLENKIFLYCNDNKEKEVVVNLDSIKKFKNSGLTVEWYKPGSDQYINIPDEYIYFRVHQNFDDSTGKYSKMDSGYPIFAKYNLQTSKIDFFGEQPAYYEYSYYGIISSVYDLYIGDSIISTSQINGDVQVINTIKNTVSTLTIKSKYDTRPIKEWRYEEGMKDAKNKQMKHALESAFYEPLFYNPYNHNYYRVFHPYMEEFNKDGLLNTEMDKKSVLMIFNNQMEIIDEILLPINKLQILKLYPTDKGVYMSLPTLFRMTPDKAEFHYLRVELKK